MNRLEPNRNVYVGHRYVPLLVGEWDKSIQYEGLSIVTYQGGSYTSKKRTPAGIDIENEEYWVLTGNYNAQIEYYRQETQRVSDDLAQAKINLNKTMDDTVQHVNSNVEDLTIYVNDEVRKNKDYVDGEVSELTGYVDDSVNDNKTWVTDHTNEVRERLDRTEPIYHIDQFGSIGDGDSDDSVPIQTAIDEAYNNGGGTVIASPEKIYGMTGTISIKDNVILDFKKATLKRIDELTSTRMIGNDRHGNRDNINVNIEIKNLIAVGTGKENGVSDQGSAIGLWCVDGVTLDNIKTENTNGDGIQWREVNDMNIKNIYIGDFGRNGISPTSGLNTVWDNVHVVGNPIEGANPGKDIDAETNTSFEKGTNFVNNLTCRNLTLVDFYTEDGGNFSQQWMLNNAIIGPDFNALQIRSTNHTKGDNIVINSNCKIINGDNGSAIRLDNVDNVKFISPTIDMNNDSDSMIIISGQVENLLIDGIETNKSNNFMLQTNLGSELNNSTIKNIEGKRILFSGRDNIIKNCNLTRLTIRDSDSVGNILNNTNANNMDFTNGADFINQHFGTNKGIQGKSFYTREKLLGNNTSDNTIELPLPETDGYGSGFLVSSNYSYGGRIDHSASLLCFITIGDLSSSVNIINQSGEKIIEVDSVDIDKITLSVNHQYAGYFTATIIR